MAAATFKVNTNAWYRINVTSLSGYSLYGWTFPASANKTSTTFRDTYSKPPVGAITEPGALFHWQLIPISYGMESVYMLRNRNTGPSGYLVAVLDEDPRPAMWGYNEFDPGDKQLYWRVLPWGDDSWALSNLALSDQSHLHADEDLKVPVPRFRKADDTVKNQRFLFPMQGQEIDDPKYSTIGFKSTSMTIGSQCRTAMEGICTDAPVSITSAQNQIIPTHSTSANSFSTPLPTSDPAHNTSNSPSGNSSGRIGSQTRTIIIATVIPLTAALVACIIAILFLLRRQRRKKQKEHGSSTTTTSYDPEERQEIKAEISSKVLEMQGSRETVELASDRGIAEVPARRLSFVELESPVGRSELGGNYTWNDADTRRA